MIKPIRYFMCSRTFIAAVLLTCLLGWAGCESGAARQAKPLRVLFIGNSYTYENNLPEMLRQFSIAGKRSRPLEYTTIAPGDSTLHMAWDRRLASNTIAKGGWDYVVLQEHSTAPLNNRASMIEYGKLFDKQIRKSGAHTVLYVTWARRGIPGQQQGINDAYSSLALETGALVCPVGPARATVVQTRTNLDLYQADGSHPSPAGTYLAACMFYNMFYGASPSGLPCVVRSATNILADLPKKDAVFLQKTAVQSIKEWRARPSRALSPLKTEH